MASQKQQYEFLIDDGAQKHWDDELFGEEKKEEEVQNTTAWRLLHALAFATGGLTFIAGTACYYVNPQTDAIGDLAAALYTIGSVGFLTVDVMEFFTPAYTICPLRGNIAMSAIGSTWYVIGSVGYLPSILNETEAVGVWGFILGSFFIGVSQIWKVLRYATDEEEGTTSLSVLLSSKDRLTGCGVEGGACTALLQAVLRHCGHNMPPPPRSLHS